LSFCTRAYVLGDQGWAFNCCMFETPVILGWPGRRQAPDLRCRGVLQQDRGRVESPTGCPRCRTGGGARGRAGSAGRGGRDPIAGSALVPAAGELRATGAPCRGSPVASGPGRPRQASRAARRAGRVRDPTFPARWPSSPSACAASMLWLPHSGCERHVARAARPARPPAVR